MRVQLHSFTFLNRDNWIFVKETILSPLMTFEPLSKIS